MTDWSRRPEVLDAEERYGDHSEWERQIEEHDAFLHDDAFARDPTPDDGDFVGSDTSERQPTKGVI